MCSGSVPPSLSNRRSCSTRSSLTWTAPLISPISSRKIVPPAARSKYPFRVVLSAPVYAPFSVPKSSLSSRPFPGWEAQLTSTNGRSLRKLLACIARGDQALARSALAHQKDRRIGPGDLVHPIEDVPDPGAFADDVRVGDGRRPGRGFHAPHVLLLLQRSFYGGEQLLELHRLGQVGEGAVAHGLDGRLHRGERRHHDDTRFRRGAGHALDQVQAVDPGHFHIREQHVESAAAGRFIGLLAVRHPRDLVPLARQQLHQGLPGCSGRLPRSGCVPCKSPVPSCPADRLLRPPRIRKVVPRTARPSPPPAPAGKV